MGKAIVFVVYGAYLALVAYIFLFVGKQLMLPSIPSALFAVAAWIGIGIFASQTNAWGLANSPVEDLDEREAKVRSGAYWSAYIGLFVVVFLSLIGLTFGSEWLRVTTWDVSDVSALVWGVFLLGLTLPSAVLMWSGAGKNVDEEQ